MRILLLLNLVMVCFYAIDTGGGFNSSKNQAASKMEAMNAKVYRDTLCGIAIDSLVHACAPQSKVDAPRRLVKFIKNISDGPLILSDARTNDPNYIAHFPSHPLAPGQVDSLVFHMAPGQRGVFRKWFFILAPDNCRLQGELRYELR